MPKFSLLGIGMLVAVIGMVLIAIATSGDRDQPAPLGLSVFGAGMALMGLDAIVTGQIKRFGPRGTSFFGLAARLQGGVMLLTGLGIALMSLLELVAPGNFESFIHGHMGQGTLMVGFGLIGVLGGASLLLSRQPSAGSQTLSLLVSLPARIAGLVLILLSLAAMVAGALRIVAPAMLDGLFNSLLRSLAR